MAFPESIAGSLTARLWANPLAGASVTFGAGAGLFAGADTFLTTEGSASQKADAGATSALKWGVGSAAVLGGGFLAASTASAFRAGYDRYQPSNKPFWHPGRYRSASVEADIGYGAANLSKDASRFWSRTVGAYAKDVINEVRAPGGWKTALMRPCVSGGLGAIVGGFIGSQVSDDSTKGAAIGATMGAGAGIALGRAVKASQVWSKLGPITRTGGILALSAAVGVAIKTLSPSQPEVLDRAEPEDNSYRSSGIQDRMRRIGASGDLVFGLHNSR